MAFGTRWGLAAIVSATSIEMSMGWRKTLMRSLHLIIVSLLTLVVASSEVVLAQLSREWAQCTGGEGPIVDVVIGGCSAVIQTAQDESKRLAAAFNNRGVAYRMKGAYDRALQDYDQAILLNPSLANAYNNRGLIYRIQGEYDRAISDYDQAIWLDNRVPAHFYNRAIAYMEMQDYDHALLDFDTVLGFNGNNALALYGRGTVELKKGDARAGTADMETAKELNPRVVEEFERVTKH